MNKFLKQYPQLWVPKVGNVIVVVKPIGGYNPDYYHIGAKAIITDCMYMHRSGMYYKGNFNPFNPEIKKYTGRRWTGYCELGVPFMNFVLYTNEQIS